MIVQLSQTFYHDISKLSQGEVASFKSRYPDATYSWWEFRADVLGALQLHYGSQNVSEGNKCINCRKEYLLEADVVPCANYRSYQSLSPYTGESYVEGMTFWTRRELRQVINYPKQHISNGARKNEEARGEYKASIRMFKNARNYLIDKKLVPDGIAPSYFIEGLLYNVPAQLFGSNRQRTYEGVVGWLLNANRDGFICQNGQVALFGSTPEQWNKEDALTMIAAWQVLWNKWGSF
ncbi:MAG: nucleotidyltransferase [Patescibacteria group bacterium]|nr:MAG: nucleotidyltransferase [Patescibacteria group bacterium]